MFYSRTSSIPSPFLTLSVSTVFCRKSILLVPRPSSYHVPHSYLVPLCYLIVPRHTSLLVPSPSLPLYLVPPSCFVHPLSNVHPAGPFLLPRSSLFLPRHSSCLAPTSCLVPASCLLPCPYTVPLPCLLSRSFLHSALSLYRASYTIPCLVPTSYLVSLSYHAGTSPFLAHIPLCL